MRSGTFAPALAVALVAAALPAAAQDPSEAIYDESRLTRYDLSLSAADWTAICNDGTGSGDLWKRGTMTWTNGSVTETVDGVGIKRSGKYSAGIDTPKPSIRLSFNEFEFDAQKRKWRGVNRIKLDSMIGNTDVTMMRDRLAYWTFRQFGVAASRASHARLYVNGDYKGLYTVEEPIKQPFCQYLWGEKDGNLYVVEYGSHYTWLGSNPALYVPDHFIPENNYPGGDYSDVVRLVDIVDRAPTNQIASLLNGHINLDAFYHFIACQIIIADGDSLPHQNPTWGRGNSNNHSWYHRAGTNRLEIIKWDPGASQGLYDATSGYPKGESPMFTNYDSVPMVAWLLADPAANSALKDRIRTIINGSYASNVLSRIDDIYNQIQAAAHADPYKGISPNLGSPAPLPNGFTDAEFDAARGWLKDWYSRRIAYLRSQVGTATLPTVTIAATDNSAAEPSNVGVFTVTRTGSTSAGLNVSLARTGTAGSGDCNAMPATLTIPAGSASATITVTPVDDTAVESNETVILTVSTDAAYTVGTPSSATVTIADNDTAPLPVVTITATDGDASESGDTGAFTVSRTGSTTSSLTVQRQRSGTAALTGDYATLPSPFVIPAGSASVTIPVTPVDDTAVEGPETLIVTLLADPAYTVGTPSSATVTIADNDTSTVPTVTISATDPDAAEPTATGTFAVSRTGATTAALNVSLTRTGTAGAGDCNAMPTTVTIPAGAGSATITVTPVDDTVVEGPETVVLTIAANAAYTVGTASSATVTIADDDTTTGGLSGTYYDNPDFTGTSVTRTDPQVDFDWAAASPASAIGPDTFSIRWTGRVRASYNETYTFYTFTNDGVRLWVEGDLLVDHWQLQSGGAEWSAQVALRAGHWYTIQMEYYENLGNAVARLLWSSPSIPKQAIPPSALDPALGALDSRDNDGDGIPNDSDPDDDNDGIPDLEDPDRDGDTLTNLTEDASGSDPDDRNSPYAGGIPPPIPDGDNSNGNRLLNDSLCGATGLDALAFLGLVALFRVRRRSWNSSSLNRSCSTLLALPLLGIAAPLAGASEPPVQANAVPDPSFEAPASTTRWISADYASTLATSRKRTGAQSMELLNDGTGVPGTAVHNVTQSNIPVPGVLPGQEFEFTVYVRGENVTGIGGGGKPLTVLRWRNSSNQRIAQELYNWAPYGTYDFQPSTLHLQAPAGAAAIDVGFRSWWDCLTGRTYWDDAALVPRVIPGRGALLATYQAETAQTRTGGVVASAIPDYTGAGYFDVTTSGAILEWTDVAGGGDRVVAVRYSWEGWSQPVELLVNGASRGEKTPVWTGRRGSYATEHWTATLPAGSNTIRLRIEKAPVTGEPVQPLIDRLEVYATTTSSSLPTVTVTASDPSASEPANAGTFTISRTGSTASALAVPYAVTGTASPGADYAALPASVSIPAGQSSVQVTVTPQNDAAPEPAETVVLTISPSAAYTPGTPSSATVTIADDDSAPPASTGLTGRYYDNADFTGTLVTRVDPAVDFNWGAGSPAAGIGGDTFSARWTGRVTASATELTTFSTFTNDGVRLWIEGELLVDKWVDQSGGLEWSAALELVAGRSYTVQMDYYENLGNAVARLSWASPTRPKEVIPTGQLLPDTGLPPGGDIDADGVPDLQDPDRDGDGYANAAEMMAGTDPNDPASFPAGGGGGEGEEGCGATGLEALAFLRLLLLPRRRP